MLYELGPLQIRYSEEGDIPILARFLMQPGVMPFFPMCDQREVDDAAKVWIGYREHNSAYTALYDGEVVGMTNVYVSPFGKLKKQSLFSIIVDEKMRGQGIGGMLLDHLEEAAKDDHGIELLHLEVYEDNPAKRLYERKGFVEYGKHPNFLREPDGFRTKILMQKMLV